MRRYIIFIMSFFMTALTYSLEVKEDKIIDKTKNKIEKKEYKRVVILDPAVVEMFYLIGGERNIVAISETTTTNIWPEEKTEKLEKVGTLIKPSIEKILACEPDLVILGAMSTGFIDSLKTRGLNYLVNDGKNLNSILNNLELYGVIAGKEESAKKVADSYRERLKDIKESIKLKPLNLKGAFLFSTTPMMAFTEASIPGEIFQILGIKNIATGIVGKRPIISSEYLIAQNPDILVGSMGIEKKDDILNSNPFVKETKAGKNKNIFILDSGKILRGTPRVIDEIVGLHKELKDVK